MALFKAFLQSFLLFVYLPHTFLIDIHVAVVVAFVAVVLLYFQLVVLVGVLLHFLCDEHLQFVYHVCCSVLCVLEVEFGACHMSVGDDFAVCRDEESRACEHLPVGFYLFFVEGEALHFAFFVDGGEVPWLA